jgi:multidrug efflux pump subunit AcrB
MKGLPQLLDLATDRQNLAARTVIKINREIASRLGVTPQDIDDTLYDAFGQRQVGTIFTQLNQYKVILEVDPKYQMGPEALSAIYVKSNTGEMVPLSAVTTMETVNAPLIIGHQGQFPAVTLSFNLAKGTSLGEATAAIQELEKEVRLPPTVQPTFQGTAQAFQDSLTTMPLLIIAAIIAVYIVLGVLYESYIHPLTILSTVPSAGLGALLLLKIFGMQLDMMGLIGLVLLIGIVEKNAIMMIDFALEAERHRKMAAEDSIYEAAQTRFRPIMMTSVAALMGGLMLMVAFGAGSEFRRPLGVAIVGGILLSQAITLFTTPVVYIYLDRFGKWLRSARGQSQPALQTATPTPRPISLDDAAE